MGARSPETGSVSNVRKYGERILMTAGVALAITGPVHTAVANIEAALKPHSLIASSNTDIPIRTVSHDVQTGTGGPSQTQSDASVLFDLSLIPAGYVLIYAGAHRRVRKFFASLPPAERT